MTLGEKVRYIREKNQLTSEEFARIIGVSQSFISKVETEQKLPGRKTIQSICEKFTVPSAFFFNSAVKTPEEVAPNKEMAEELAKYVPFLKVIDEAIDHKFTPEEIMQMIAVAKQYKK